MNSILGSDDDIPQNRASRFNRKALGQVLTAVEGWLSKRETDFLFRGAKRCQKDGVILEIGSFKGKSTICLAFGARSGGRQPIFAIDPHINTLEQNLWLAGRPSFEIFRTNIAKAGVADIVFPIVKTSAEAAKEWDKPIAFLWIDGDHTYNGAKSDFDLFSPWVIEGGVIAFHDTTQGDVTRVVCECFGQKGFSQIGLVDSITHATKISGVVNTARDRFVLWVLANYARLRRVIGVKRVKHIFKWGLSKI